MKRRAFVTVVAGLLTLSMAGGAAAQGPAALTNRWALRWRLYFDGVFGRT